MRITAAALAGLVTWLARDHWRDAFQEVLEEHFGEPCEAAGLDTFDELADIAGDHWFNTLWGCAFGDLLTRPTEHGTIVDDYLKRRGWNETALHRAYMEALRDSVMSLYEVSDIRAGESLPRARPRPRRRAHPGARAHGHPDAEAVGPRGPADRRGAWPNDDRRRHAAVRGRAGRRCPRDAAGVIDGAPPAVVAMLDEGDAGPPPEDMRRIAEQLAMRLAAPIFTAAWLSNHLDELLDPQPPTVMNSDGEAMELIRLHYRLAEGVTAQQLRAALDATPELHPASATFLNWLQPPNGPPPAGAMPEGAHMAFSTMPDGSVVLGTLELEGRALEVQVSSESRAERVRALLAARLPNLVSEPLTVRQTLEQALAEHREKPPPSAGHGLPPEEERQVIQQVLDWVCPGSVDGVGLAGLGGDGVGRHGTANIFADLGDADADTHLLKAELVSRIQDRIDERKLTQVQAAKVMGIGQPRRVQDAPRPCRDQAGTEWAGGRSRADLLPHHQ